MLRMENLSCGYHKKMIINQLNLDIHPGKFTAIIGPNGAGKTTLLRGIGKLIEVKGKILYQGVDLGKLSRKERSKKIALLSQSEEHYFSFPVKEILLMGRYPHLPTSFSTYREEDYEKVGQIMKELSLTHLSERNIMELSGGQRQRVLLGRALVQEPDILLLDEPTNHLDLSHQLTLLEYVKKWAKAHHKAVIVVLHDLNVVMKYADDVILLGGGKLILKAPVKQVMNHQLLSQEYGLNIPAYMKDSLAAWSQC